MVKIGVVNDDVKKKVKIKKLHKWKMILSSFFFIQYFSLCSFGKQTLRTV